MWGAVAPADTWMLPYASLQEKRFLRMLAEAGAPALQRHEVPAELLQPLLPRYEAALSELESAVKVGPRL